MPTPPTITYQQVVNSTNATLTVDATGATPGNYTVTDPSSGATSTLEVKQGGPLMWIIREIAGNGGMQNLGGGMQ